MAKLSVLFICHGNICRSAPQSRLCGGPDI